MLQIWVSKFVDLADLSVWILLLGLFGKRVIPSYLWTDHPNLLCVSSSRLALHAVMPPNS